VKTVLVFGAGRVSGPCVDYLARKGNCKVVVADLSEENLSVIAGISPVVETVREDVGKAAGSLIDKYKPNLVVNLMPPALMFPIAKTCLEKKTHLVHPAYLDQATKDLEGECKKAGLVFITELGLDPGIDHMSAASTIKKIHDKGGKVESYSSYCGALPAADANTNPWGYKLSWSPSSLIGASKRTAKILSDGKEVLWPDGETYEHVEFYEVPPLGAFEIYANGDSIPYRKAYDIPEASNIYRGTIRYPGWCETICHMNSLKFFEEEKQNTKGLTFAQFTARQAGGSGDAKESLCKALNVKPWSTFILRMEWLGFFENRPLPLQEASPRDVVSILFGEKLVFTPEEKDLVILCDEIKVVNPNGKKQSYNSTMIDYGVPGKWTSIARTTGIPPAVAARFVLEGKIALPGVHIPTIPEIYEPVLGELREEGIYLQEAVVDL
jgi:saccharopine dehydrogenase-like NADP-dependent oxidoreductase